MSQDEVYKFLKRKANKNKWMSTKEISNGMKVNNHTVGNSLLKLYNIGEVDRKEVYASEGVKYKFFLWRVK